jgi:hypothetical protein
MRKCCKVAIAKIPEDEPVFCIFGRDTLAIPVILAWIDQAILMNVSTKKILRVTDHLQAIYDFQRDNPDRVHLPD